MQLQGGYLPVVHVTLAGVVTKESVDHDELLALVEPSILATEQPFGLAGSRGHEEPRKDTDNEGDNGLKEEQPSPATPAEDASHLQYTRRKQGSDDVAGAESSPEEGQSDGQLVRLVEVGEPEDNITGSLLASRRIAKAVHIRNESSHEKS